MKPRSISATSIEVYEQCPMRFAAETTKRVSTTSNGPSAFGSALHATLDKYIEKLTDDDGNILVDEHQPDLLADIWEAACQHYLGFSSAFADQGTHLLKNWLLTRELPRRVMMREAKESFEVPILDTDETQKVAYICDRVDGLDAAVQVVDYKSQWEMVGPDKMRQLIQPNLYALAMSKRFNVDRVAVQYDMLRYEPVTVFFDADDMAKFDRYLSRVAKRIHDDENPREFLGKGCRYCPRKTVCKTFAKAGDMGYAVTQPLDELAATKERAMAAKKALETMVGEIDELLLAEMREYDLDVLDLGAYTAKGSQTRNTVYPVHALIKILGEEAYPYLKAGKTAIDDAAKLGRINPDEMEQIKEAAIRTAGEPRVKVAANKGAAA